MRQVELSQQLHDFFGRVGDARGAHAPKPLPGPGATLQRLAIIGPAGPAMGLGLQDSGQVAVAEAAVGRRMPQGQPTRSAPCQRARVSASAIFTLLRAVPTAAAPTSQVRALSPRDKKAASSALLALGSRASGPGGRGG